MSDKVQTIFEELKLNRQASVELEEECYAIIDSGMSPPKSQKIEKMECYTNPSRTQN